MEVHVRHQGSNPAGRERSWLGRFVGAAVLALSLAVAVGPAVAQNTVPPELLNNNRTSLGDTLRFCVDDFAPAADFNKAVSQAIADSLLVKATFSPGPSGFALDGQGYMDELQLIMSTSCDAFAGISIEPDSGISIYPEWATVTRAYATVPFVFVVKDPAYTKLGDIPGGKKIGSTMGSVAQGQLVTYIGQQPQSQQWLNLPYADPKLMLKRLEDGTIDGMAIWQPVLNQITDGDPAKLGLKIVPMDPVQPAAASVGYLVQASDSYLRSQLDTAIGSLISDGTIAKIMQQFNYQGTPGP
jgi:polar amino acid transport system substrate-binding protein